METTTCPCYINLHQGEVDGSSKYFKTKRMVFLKSYHWNDWLNHQGSHSSGLHIMSKLADTMQQQRKMVEQLRQEAQINRIRVSECIEELKKFCEQHESNDVLIKGFSRPNDNPFKEKGGCNIL